MRRRREGVVLNHGAHVQADVVGRDVVLVAGAGEPAAVFRDAVQVVGIGEALLGAVFLDPVLHVVGVAAALVAVEAIGAAPHLAQRGHRHARGADRAGAGREIAHEHGQRAGGAVRLDRQLIDQIRAGDAPVRQRLGVGVDVGQHDAVRAGIALAGDRVHAVEHGVFTGDGDDDVLGAIACGLAQLLRRAAHAQPCGGEVRSKRHRWHGHQQAGERRQKQTDHFSHHRYPPCRDVFSPVYENRRLNPDKNCDYFHISTDIR